MSIAIGVLSGVVLTSSIWLFVENRNNKVEPVEEVNIEEIIKSTMEIHKPSLNLTEPDLLKVPCSSEFIEKQNSDLLCREMWCRMTTRGIDSKTSGSECEQISNIQNKKVILEECLKLDPEDSKACIDLFDRRL